MRVLMIGWSANEEGGGMEVHIKELCRNLISLGHSVELVVPKSASKTFGDTGAIMNIIPCKVNCDSMEAAVKSIARYNKKIIASSGDSNFGFDAIHSHDWLGVESAEFLSKKHKKPWIHTVHSLEHIRAAEETDTLEKRISDIERRGILDCDRIITVSNLMKKEIVKKFRVHPEKISVIYNGATFGNELAVRSYAKKASPTVLFAGRLALQKGIEHLILAFEKALKSFPSARLVIAGNGNLDDSLKSLVMVCGIEKSVVFRGFVGEEDLKELYRAADLFVSPSIFEPFGITVLDSANFGAPIIATKNTGCLELFSRGSIAVVEPQNSGALAGEITRLLGDGDARMNMAGRAKEDLKNADGWKEIAERTAEVYFRI